jgi:hypothetical protein
MTTSSEQDRKFIEAVVSGALLEESIGWIASNLSPIEVFGEEALENWAQENGYVKAG